MEISFGAAPRLLAAHLYNVPPGGTVRLVAHLPQDADPAREHITNPENWQAHTVYDEEPGWARVEVTSQGTGDAMLMLDAALDGRSASTVGVIGSVLMLRVRGDADSAWVEPQQSPPASSQSATVTQRTDTTVQQQPDVTPTGEGTNVEQTSVQPGTSTGADATSIRTSIT